MDGLLILLFLVSFSSLVVGLIKPEAFSSVIKGNITRKKIAAIFGIPTVLLFIILSGTTTDTSKNSQVVQNPTTNTEIPIPANAVENKVPIKTQDKPAPITTTPIQVKQTESQNTSPISTETVSQKNAVKKAKSYLGYSAFSHDELVSQLEYEQFTHTDAVYGADNSGANWNEQAAKKAKSYMQYSAFSRGSLIEQLKYDKFTQAQAEYGANSVGL